MRNMRHLLVLFLAVTAAAADRPNVLWFIVDDMSANFGCYGEKTVTTPNLDRLAREGTRFSRAYVTAPVCSPCRSALVTGMYQTTIGAHHHRSGRGELKIHLPGEVVPTPKLFQNAGYYTCIGSGLPDLDFRGLPYGQPKGKKAKAAAKYEPVALYHLTADPSETKNLAAEQPERVKAMRARLAELLKDAVPPGNAGAK